MLNSLWIWLVLLYGVIKGAREIVKKKSMERSSVLEVLFLYTLLSFLFVVPTAPAAVGVEPQMMLYIVLKSFVIFVAWILGFKALRKIPISLYGLLDLSRVIFSTLMGVIFLREVMHTGQIIGLIFVCAGLLLCRYGEVFTAKKETEMVTGAAGQKEISASAGQNEQGAIPTSAGQKAQKVISASVGQKKSGKETEGAGAVSVTLVFFALCSAFLNGVSGTLDKALMRSGKLTSTQLQFWYMLFLVLFYGAYIVITREKIHWKATLKNYWIWILSIIFVIGDKALFIANQSPDSKVTVMTLLKQVSCIVTILAGKFLFKEKKIAYKLFCAAVIITGMVIAVL